MNKRIKYVPAILWSALIFVLCFLPGSAIPKEDWLDKIHFDKFVHAFLYFVLFILLFYGMRNYRLPLIMLAIGICIGQGILIECIQGSLIPDRSFDGWDIIANIFGIVLAVFFVKRHYERSL